jgi:ClpP class serine protease
MRHIDIDDAESVLKAIRGTQPGKTIEIILHTPGGLVLAASQIARALRDHDGRVVAVVPHYAMSGGTLIALAADEIVLDGHAALGPVDPQLGQYPAASLVEVASLPVQHQDQTLILADVDRKALRQVEAVVTDLLKSHSDPSVPATSLACSPRGPGHTTTRSWRRTWSFSGSPCASACRPKSGR